MIRLNRKATEKLGVHTIKLEMSSGMFRHGQIDVSADSMLEAFERFRGSTTSWVLKGYDAKTGKGEIELTNFFLIANAELPRMKDLDVPDPKASKQAMFDLYERFQTIVDRASGSLLDLLDFLYEFCLSRPLSTLTS